MYHFSNVEFTKLFKEPNDCNVQVLRPSLHEGHTHNKTTPTNLF